MRINMTVTEGDLRAIDSAAKRRGLRRSTFLVLAAKEVMSLGA